MNKQHKEINDDEIRIISSSQPEKPQSGTSRRTLILWLLAAIVIDVVILLAFYFAGRDESEEPTVGTIDTENVQEVNTGTDDNNLNDDTDVIENNVGYVAVTDTVVDKVALKIFTPANLTPNLHVGNDIVGDKSVKMLFPAADIRGDNGEIVGAFVLNGELLSKGMAKAGFCSIISGKITVGVADATPLLEQALESDGDFFRQYPLVVGGQIVENKPKGKSQRKALAELGGEIVVITTDDRLTFHDFSQSLVDLGVSNAIYLIGSTTYGFAIDPDGNKIEIGNPDHSTSQNSNYIVWK